MERYLDQLFDLMDKHNCPALWAGDVFNHWNEPAELVNFIIRKFKERHEKGPYPIPDRRSVFAIPGQHDLPHHRISDIKRTAFWTLVEPGFIHYIDPEIEDSYNPHMIIQGFPWGVPFTEAKYKAPSEKKKVKIALIHRYVWRDGHSHPGAKDEDHVDSIRKQLQGFDVIVSGDNHSGFISNKKTPVVCNCGSFIRRKSDEMSYRPMVGLIHDDGSVTPHYLDTSEDVFLNPSELAKIIKSGIDVSQFLAELNQLGDKAINFREAIEECLRNESVREEVATIILKAMEQR